MRARKHCDTFLLEKMCRSKLESQRNYSNIKKSYPALASDIHNLILSFPQDISAKEAQRGLLVLLSKIRSNQI